MDKATEKAFLENLVRMIEDDTIPHLEYCRDNADVQAFCCYNPTLKTFLSNKSEYGAWPNPEMANQYPTEFDADAARSFIRMNEGYLQPWKLIDAINHQIAQEKKELEKWKEKLAEFE